MNNKTIIHPVCPKCGNVLTIKLHIIQSLRDEILRLKREITDLKDMSALNNILGGFGK